MIYTVTLRNGKTGGKDTLELEAPDRAAVWALLKERGITSVLSVTEGKASASKGRGRSSSPSWLKGAVAGIVVVLAAIGAWLILSPDTEAPEQPAKKPAAKAAPPAPSPRQEPKPPRVKPHKKPANVSQAMENLGEFEPMPKPAATRVLTSEELDRLTNRVFKTGTEQLMSWVFSTEVGDMPMPIPRISDEDRENIVGILLSSNPIGEGDSDRVKECKESVDYAKKEMLEYLRNGGDPDEFLHFYFNELRRAFEYRNEAADQIQEIWDENPEFGMELLDEVNKHLSERGIKQINKEQFE